MAYGAGATERSQGPRGSADSLFFGFGFEGIADAVDRNQVIGRSVEYLLGSP